MTDFFLRSIPPELHHKLKMHCAAHNISMRSFILQTIASAIEGKTGSGPAILARDEDEYQPIRPPGLRPSRTWRSTPDI